MAVDDAGNSASADRPVFERVDHVSWSVPDLDAAVGFYAEVFGAKTLYRLGPMDSRDIPHDDAGRDWTTSHVNVEDARLTLVMMALAPNMNFQLVQYHRPASAAAEPPRNCDRGGHHLAFTVDDVDRAARYLAAHGCTVFEQIEVDDGPGAGRFHYVLDPWGHQIELCQYPKPQMP